MSSQRTYWHLEGRGRVPTDYEVVTSGLLYYPGRRFSVRTPVAEWIERHQRSDRLRCTDWDSFEDPRATTYASYTELQHQRAIFVEGLLQGASGAQDPGPSSALRALARDVLAPLRHPAHALQMAGAYVGSMAPSGRLLVALAFQSADQLRVVHALAQRLALLGEPSEAIATHARARWQAAPEWQPWRRLMERLLVTDDFDEALIALGLAVKPAFDEVFLGLLGRAVRSIDAPTAQLLASLAQDAVWQLDLMVALFQMLGRQDPENLARAAELLDPWAASALGAVEVTAAHLGPALGGGEDAAALVRARLTSYWARIGLENVRPEVGA